MTKRVLVSVYNKEGIVEMVRILRKYDYEVISTGGTARRLTENGIDVLEVDRVTDFPEMMEGRVKTLHPAIHAGLLAVRENRDHMEELAALDIKPIDMVIVNLYPFAETISRPDVKLKEALENIDIGGPTMIRAAAKNFRDVCVITDPGDYSKIITELEDEGGRITLTTRRKLAEKAFKVTAGYDRMIYNYLQEEDMDEGVFPEEINLNYSKKMDLRYGENPHQQAAFYRDEKITEPSVTGAEQLHGRGLSFNNINDTDSALKIVREFAVPAAAVIKHTNPCGLAAAGDILTAYEKAYAGDPVSAYGSIVALNRKVDGKTAKAITGPDKFVEVIIAPDYETEALEILKNRWENIRILRTGDLTRETVRESYELKQVTGGLLVQDINDLDYWEDELEVVSERQPGEEQYRQLLFAWKGVKHVKSNAIVMARNNALVGVGAGQMSRVDAMIIAARKAGDRTGGAVAASDAFLPFRDAVDKAAKYGIEAIIQPGGSIRDKEVIEAADEHNMVMVFTGCRHFKH